MAARQQGGLGGGGRHGEAGRWDRQGGAPSSRGVLERQGGVADSGATTAARRPSRRACASSTAKREQPPHLVAVAQPYPQVPNRHHLRLRGKGQESPLLPTSIAGTACARRQAQHAPGTACASCRAPPPPALSVWLLGSAPRDALRRHGAAPHSPAVRGEPAAYTRRSPSRPHVPHVRCSSNCCTQAAQGGTGLRVGPLGALIKVSLGHCQIGAHGAKVVVRGLRGGGRRQAGRRVGAVSAGAVWGRRGRSCDVAYAPN